MMPESNVSATETGVSVEDVLRAQFSGRRRGHQNPPRTVTLAFTLSMPNVGSWNGKWSGAATLYCRLIRFNGKKRRELADKVLAGGPYFYSWSDGWGASIKVRRVLPDEARKLRRESKGFCGYDWMIDTIIKYGKPLADHEIPALPAARENAASSSPSASLPPVQAERGAES